MGSSRDGSSRSFQRVHVNGVDMAYLESGRGPLVLLVHGFPDTAHTWDVVRPRVAELGYRVVAPFTRGYFPTEVSKDARYDSDTLGADLIALIAALGEREAVILGHDWGASAAFSAVGLAPERVSLLITSAIPHPASMKPTPSLLWSVRHFASLGRAGAAGWVAKDNFAHIDELVQRWSPTWEVPPGETDRVKEAFRNPGCLDAALGYYRAISPFLPKSQRRRVMVPSVGLAAVSDIIPVSHYHRAASRYGAGYQVKYLPGGHFAHRQDPKAFIQALTEVLNEHGPRLRELAARRA